MDPEHFEGSSTRTVTSVALRRYRDVLVKFVDWYNSQPDGPLPARMNNDMFLNARDAAEALNTIIETPERS